MPALENSISPYWLDIMNSWKELDEEQIKYIISHVVGLEKSLELVRRANMVAEQKLGEALGHDTTGRYPGLPQLVEQVADLRKELLYLRSIVNGGS